MAVSVADRALFTELAAIFARAALRLTQRPAISPFSGPREPDNQLDLPRPQSESVTAESSGGRA